jgi:hypothetical protein
LVEQFTTGPFLGLRNRADDVLHLRSRESLRRLGDIAARRPVPAAGAPRE